MRTLLRLVPAALVALALPAGVARAAESVTYQANPAHDGFVDEPVAPPLAVRWAHPFGTAISYPVVAGGRVFVTTANSGDGVSGTVLHALDAASGAEQWSA